MHAEECYLHDLNANTMTENSSTEGLNQHWIFAISVLCTGLFCAFGFVGNILSIIALSKERSKNSNVYLLMALSLADWCFLLFIFNGVVTVQFCKYFNYHAYLDLLRNSGHALPTIWAFGCIIQTGAIWFVVAVTWDRFYAIGWPIKRNKRRSKHRACKLIGGVIMFSVLFNIPRFFHFHTMNRKDIDSSIILLFNDTSFTSKNCTATSQDPNSTQSSSTSTPSKSFPGVNATHLYENMWYHYIYYTCLSWLVMYIIPLCTLIILNGLLFRQIRKAQRNHAILVNSKRERDSISVTVNIVAIVTIFITCQAPDFIHTLISYPSFGAHGSIKEYMKSAAYAFLAFNSSINFIVYCLFYKRFRNTVLRMFCSKNSRFSVPLQKESKSVNHPDLTTLL